MPGWEAAKTALALNRENSAQGWEGCKVSAGLGDFWFPGRCTQGLCFRLSYSTRQTVPVCCPPLSCCSFALSPCGPCFSSYSAPKSFQSTWLEPSPGPQKLTLCLSALQDATAEPVLAGTGVHGCLSMASAVAGWDLLDSGPNSGLHLCLL